MKFKTLKKWVHDICTEPDNNTICPVRILGIGGFIWALVASGWSVIALGTPIDMMAFGGCYSAMLAALGLALGMKTDSSSKDVSKEVTNVIKTEG